MEEPKADYISEMLFYEMEVALRGLDPKLTAQLHMVRSHVRTTISEYDYELACKVYKIELEEQAQLICDVIGIMYHKFADKWEDKTKFFKNCRKFQKTNVTLTEDLEKMRTEFMLSLKHVGMTYDEFMELVQFKDSRNLTVHANASARTILYQIKYQLDSQELKYDLISIANLLINHAENISNL